MDKVFIRSASEYDADLLFNTAEQLLTSCGLDELVSSETTVLLKPNILMKALPGDAVTTHPAVLEAVIKCLKKRRVKSIVIADSPSRHFTLQRMEGIYTVCGYKALEDDVVRCNRDITGKTVKSAGKRAQQFEILSAVIDADVVINLPKLKTHAMAGMSGAVKNCFGVIPGNLKSELHFRFTDRREFSDMLCELYDTVRPSISLVDAVVGMEGEGPSAGKPRSFGFLAASVDAYSLDLALCRTLGLKPSDAATVQASIDRNSCGADWTSLDIEGDRCFVDEPIGDLDYPPMPRASFGTSLPWIIRPVLNYAAGLISPRPSVDASLCVGCGNCAEICPEKTITVKDGKAVIHKTSCIRCFCCHEVCPKHAISIKQAGIIRLLR